MPNSPIKNRQQRKAFDQIGLHEIEHEPRFAIAAKGDVVGPDKAQPDAEHAGKNAEQHILGQRGDNCQGEQNDQELLDVGEFDGKVGKRRREEEQDQQADQPAEQRCHDRNFEGLFAVASQSHRVAVERGCDR